MAGVITTSDGRRLVYCEKQRLLDEIAHPSSAEVYNQFLAIKEDTANFTRNVSPIVWVGALVCLYGPYSDKTLPDQARRLCEFIWGYDLGRRPVESVEDTAIQTPVITSLLARFADKATSANE